MIPEVSVVIPTYKREREVVAATLSALKQRAVTLEVIVVDDSPEGTARDAVLGIGDARVHYRTGASSIMHDMKDNAMVEASYGVHSKYKKHYGAAEFYAMKAFAKALR